jgi:uncharacterized membrane protein YkvA (DUF1232 family)
MARIIPPLEHIISLGSRVWKVMVSAQTPWQVKATMVVGLLYCLSPWDLIPEWVPVVGLLDDLALGVLIITYALRFVSDHPQDEEIHQAG